MLKEFHLPKLLFSFSVSDSLVMPVKSVKLYLDFDQKEALGQVQLFKVSNKIYGRVRYFVNLPTFKNTLKENLLGNLYPALRFITEGNKIHIDRAVFQLNKHYDERILQVGAQLTNRKLAQLGLSCWRDNKTLVMNFCSKTGLDEDDKSDFISIVYLGQVTPSYLISAELLIERRTATPVRILYRHPDDTIQKFYLNEI